MKIEVEKDSCNLTSLAEGGAINNNIADGEILVKNFVAETLPGWG